MKKILLIIYGLACLFSMQAQTLFGTTTGGGKDGAGTINKFMPASNELTVVKSFESVETLPYFTNFIQASDGKLYGMTTSGAIFSYDPFSSTYTKLKDLDSTTGFLPYGSLMQANDGKLYGMTTRGASNGFGGIFSFDLLTSTYTNVKDFDFINGTFAYSNLVQASDGKLYGTLPVGGENFAGVIFSIDLLTSTYTDVKDFDRKNGTGPSGGLIQASDGKLYGITDLGGSYGYGVIYSFDPSTSLFTNVKDFDLTNGGHSVNGSLIQASDGKLYGMTSSGGSSGYGVIFSFDLSTSTYANLKEFDKTNGAYPTGRLSQASDGKLYGMTPYGGSSGYGVIFSFDPSDSTYTNLKDFDSTDGITPYGSLFQASDGKFYGMTHEGGNGNYGVIFSLDPSNLTFTKLKNFGTNTTGTSVSGGLLKADDGKLYGITNSGGNNAAGVIFSIDPTTSTFTNLMDFDRTNGANPYGSLIQANDGKLYGMTAYGGSSGNGVIFSFDPAASTYTKLRDFDYSYGSNPFGSLVQANDGKLYGTTTNGGSSFAGVLFSFDPLSSIYAVLKDLDYGTGGSSYGGLLQASDGKLYGTTFYDLTNSAGSIFSFDPISSTFTNLFVLDYGAGPVGNLIQGSDGKLYGMTSGGGLNGFGTIFSFDPLASAYSNLKDFDNTNGSYPYGSLMQASDGKLYGMTCLGGNSGDGVIFAFDLSGNSYTKLKDFDGSNGAQPLFGSAFIDINECISKIYYRDADCDGYGNPECSIKACTKPAGYVSNNTDCNDSNKAVHAPVTYYRDYDRDGFGDPYHPSSLCSDVPPAGYVKNNYDCYDGEGASEPGYVRIRMCHDGWTQCVYVKDTAEKLSLGWTVGLCPLQSCADGETLMCHNGKQECVKTTYVAEKLAEPGGKWSLGPYCSGVPISKPGSNRQRKIELAGRQKSLPTQYSLSNHPNPFAGTSTIKYELPLDSKVSIKVYDLAGRAVSTLVDEYKKAGIYTVNFNAGRLSSGSLFYRIIAKSKDGQFEQTNQMIKIK